MAASIPITGVQALKGELVEKVLSVMSSCGMYDYSGAWIYDVGMPAKSGVGGGILAVLPGQFGLGVFSAPLDAKGNSVRGIETCKRLSRDFRLHVFNVAHSTSNTAIRVRYDGCTLRSRRQRPAEEVEVLQAHGSRIQVFELQGDLRFGAAESIVQQILAETEDFDSVVIDLKRVFELDHASREIFARLAQAMTELGKTVLFAHTREHYRLRKHLLRHFPEAEQEPLLKFEDVDHALEWCENELLSCRMVQPVATDGGVRVRRPVPLPRHDHGRGIGRWRDRRGGCGSRKARLCSGRESRRTPSSSS